MHRLARRLSDYALATLVFVFNAARDELQAARRSLRCARHGHQFVCMSLGHVCSKCGRWFG